MRLRLVLSIPRMMSCKGAWVASLIETPFPTGLSDRLLAGWGRLDELAVEIGAAGADVALAGGELQFSFR